ncbi:1-acyl-sn-glycerol-3-phosphate acyltransferase [bacterium]|nr:1-acyl-sn-glycerol-3-phosphate acyltransferase [bacterium]
MPSYSTPADTKTSVLPSTLAVYLNVVRVVFSSAHYAKRGKYDARRWGNSSLDIFNGLERGGCRFEITGMEHVSALDGPVVFAGNHMSTLETVILPGLINPVRPCTFVIKPSLMEYPVFRHVMRSRNPIVVSRDNPRQDLVTVLEEGAKRIAEGISIVLFPQTTRTVNFDPSQFNTLGVKLAKKAGVPVVPVALKTDAWANGKRLKEFGPIDPSKTIHFTFGAPMEITGNGREQHEAIVAFITEHLDRWRREEA